MTVSDSIVRPDRDTPPQWRSTSGKLLIAHCDQCNEHFYYPRLVCPFCFSQTLSWVECSGKGTIYSYSVVRRGDVYAIAFVTLDEGPKMMTNIVESDFNAIAVGLPVDVVWQNVKGVATPMFRLSQN